MKYSAKIVNIQEICIIFSKNVKIFAIKFVYKRKNTYFCENILQFPTRNTHRNPTNTKTRQMEKEALISALKEKSQVDNLSERTIDEVAGMFLPMFADDEKITDDTWKLPVQMVKTMSGQLRHDLSGSINDFKTRFEAETKASQEKAVKDAMDAFKAEWEKNHPDKAVDKKDDDKDQPTIDDKLAEFKKSFLAEITGEDSAFGKLSKQFGDFLTQQVEKEKQQTITSVRGQIRDYLIERGVEEDDYALEICLEKLEIGEKPDVAALKAKAEKDYEAIYNRMHKGDGGNPLKGGGGGNGGDSSADFKKFILDRQAKADQEAKDAEELKSHMM